MSGRFSLNLKIMKYSIESIAEKIPTPSTLPDGLYIGLWGGYVVTVRFNDKTFELKTPEGIRGINFRVVVEIKDGVATFSELKN